MNLYSTIPPIMKAIPFLPNLTQSLPENKVRRVEYYSKDEPEYKAGNSLQNRIKPPDSELEGDPFDRQRVIEGFDQRLIEKQNCFILGVGGIGQNVLTTLLRLGVQQISFLDNDNYDVSNLTRQTLGSIEDIGLRKVDIALKNSNLHNIRTSMNPYDLDALEHWPKIVEIAKSSSILFNCIDVGPVFDYAVNSLSKALSIPLSQGQSASWLISSELYSGETQSVCWACSSSISSSFCFQGSNFESLLNRFQSHLSPSIPSLPSSLSPEFLLSFLQKDQSFRICGSTALELVKRSVLHCLSLPLPSPPLSSLPPLVPFLLTSPLPPSDLPLLLHPDHLSHFLKSYSLHCHFLLLPENILPLPDLLFIPRAVPLPTRYFGSWVCPCVGSANMMVAQVANYLTGPTEKNPPVNITFSLSSGQSDIAEQLISLGGAVELAIPKVRDPSDPNCACCASALKMRTHDQTQLFFSLSPVSLYQSPGSSFIYHPREEGHEGGEGGTACQVVMRGGVLWRDVDVLGPEYSQLALDAVPRSDPPPCLEPFNSESTEYPASLSLPLIKGTFLPPPPSSELSSSFSGTLIRAWASGKRSALLESGGKYYRLKGCGMPEKGFTVEVALNEEGQPLSVPGKDGTLVYKIRGSSYMHTAQIELSMSDRVSGLFHSYSLSSPATPSSSLLSQMRCANKPLGAWTYTLPQTPSPHPIFPLVPRTCALFETLGDRRLGDHVLRGLELLLPALLGIHRQSGTLDYPLPSAWTLSSRRRVATLISGLANFLDGSGIPGMSREKELLLPSPIDLPLEDSLETCVDVEQWEEFDPRLPRSILLYSEGSRTSCSYFSDLSLAPSSLLSSLSPPSDDWLAASAPASLSPLWRESCHLLNEGTEEGEVGELLAFLYWRFGFECGLVGRALGEGGVGWGAYRDVTGMHMNAHANNLVLMSDCGEEASSSSCPLGRPFLSPLDFDMAYTKDTAFFGSSDPDENQQSFQSMLETERGELGFNLAVCQAQVPSSSTGTLPPVAVPTPLSLLRLALRDTLVRGWLSGLNEREEEVAGESPDLRARIEARTRRGGEAGWRRRCFALLRLALIQTWDLEA